MTPNDQDMHSGEAGREPVIDRILDHQRLQLSALMDGEVSPDEARFLLRRLEHDGELRGCWERWQLGGDVMRGLGTVVLPAGFADRVAGAIASDATGPHAVPASPPQRWARWGGGAALAASVAVVAMFLVRHAPDANAPIAAPTARVAASQPVPAQAAPQPPAVPAPVPSSPERVAQLATAVAVADAPRRVAARRSRGQSQRAARRATRESAEAPIAVAANAAPAANATAIDPFSGQVVRVPNRPWPRAMLPGLPAVGAFTVDYGSRGGDAGAPRPFYPFVPQPVPAPTEETGTQAPQRR